MIGEGESVSRWFENQRNHNGGDMKMRSVFNTVIVALGIISGGLAQATWLDDEARRQQEAHEMNILETNPCQGSVATPEEIAKVMRPGELTKLVGAHGGADLPKFTRHRTCTAVTGCTEWKRGALELKNSGFQMAVLEVASEKTMIFYLNSRTAYGGNTPTSCEMLNGELQCSELRGAVVYHSAGESTHGTPTGSYSQSEFTTMMGFPVQLSGTLTNTSPMGASFGARSGLCLWLKARVERVRGNYKDESELVFFQSGIDQSMVAPAW